MEVGSAESFDELGTLGVEEEFYVVDDRGRPTSGTDQLVYESEPPPILEDRLDHELFKCVIETQTPTAAGLEDCYEAVTAVRDALVEHAAVHGFQIAGAGLHPAAKWRELEHAEKPRYRSQLDRIQYPQHRNTTAGVHVHVGVDGGDKAVWIANEIRWFLPVMLALSANSPYWCGFDTGLASARAKVFEGLPNTGMPSAFGGIDDFLDFEELLLRTDSIRDRGELWWDVRPHTEYGTIEVRTPDGQRDPDRVMAFVEYVDALVRDLAERFEDGETATRLRVELLEENKWRAARYGHDAAFIEADRSGTVDLETVIERECDRLDVSGIMAILEAGSGAAEQRRVLEESGLGALCERLVL